MKLPSNKDEVKQGVCVFCSIQMPLWKGEGYFYHPEMGVMHFCEYCRVKRAEKTIYQYNYYKEMKLHSRAKELLDRIKPQIEANKKGLSENSPNADKGL